MSGIAQEIYALLIVYQVIRIAISDATATIPGADPDRASFSVALQVALLRCVISRLRRSMIGMLRWSDGGGEVFEGDAEPVVVGDVGSDVVVAAAQVLHEGMAGGEDPR
jgi:hypothetical protein